MYCNFFSRTVLEFSPALITAFPLLLTFQCVYLHLIAYKCSKISATGLSLFSTDPSAYLKGSPGLTVRTMHQ